MISTSQPQIDRCQHIIVGHYPDCDNIDVIVIMVMVYLSLISMLCVHAGVRVCVSGLAVIQTNMIRIERRRSRARESHKDNVKLSEGWNAIQTNMW
jgi:hypothetical protein